MWHETDLICTGLRNMGGGDDTMRDKIKSEVLKNNGTG